MIIRAYELKKDDIFKKQGVNYMVRKVTEKEIIYRWWKEECGTGSGTFGTMGKNSQERIEWVGVKPKKKITKPIKEVYESNL